MRPVVLIAALVLSAAPAMAGQPGAAKPTCEKPTTLVLAVAAVFGRSTCRLHRTEGVAPGAGLAVGQPPGNEAEPAQAAEPGHAPPRLAATMCREALPSYDAGGQAIYRPARACGRY